MNIIEEGLPFSQSLLWQLQSNAYRQSGPRAWKITNNPYIARAYAWQTIAAIRDWEQELIPEEPLYILEIGAGAGRFSYLYLRELKRLLPVHQKICLVISDNIDTYLNFWLKHPKWKQWIDEGSLDFANYDPTSSTTCRLIRSDAPLNNLKNPLIAIANYFYAALPNDRFCYRDDQLYEGYPVLKAKNLAKNDLEEDSKKMREVEVSFDEKPVTALPRYPEDPGFDGILETLTTSLKKETPFLFPIGALRAIKNLKELASGRLLLISGDKGFHTPKELEENRDHRPIVTDLGDINVDVNGLALKTYAQFLGGAMINYPRPPKTDYRDILFNHWIIYFNKPKTCAQDQFQTLFAEGFNPLDCHKLIDKTLSGNDAFTMDQILSLMQLSHYDPQLLYFYKNLNMKELFKSLEESKYHVQQEALSKVLAHFFWINKEDDALGYLLAQAFYYMRHFSKCREILCHLIALSGDSDQFRYFLGLAYKGEGAIQQANKEFRRALQLNPAHAQAGKHLT